MIAVKRRGKGDGKKIEGVPEVNAENLVVFRTLQDEKALSLSEFPCCRRNTFRRRSQGIVFKYFAFDISAFQVRSILIDNNIRVAVKEIRRRIRGPEYLGFSKIGTYLKSTASFYSYFGCIQPELQDVMDPEDIDIYWKRKGQAESKSVPLLDFAFVMHV